MDEICEIEGGERLTTHLNIEVIQLQRLCFRWWGIMYRNCRREDTERHQVGNQMRYTAIFPRFRRRCCLFPLAVCVMWSVETADMFTIYFSFAKCLANFFWLFLFIPKWLPFFFWWFMWWQTQERYTTIHNTTHARNFDWIRWRFDNGSGPSSRRYGLLGAIRRRPCHWINRSLFIWTASVCRWPFQQHQPQPPWCLETMIMRFPIYSDERNRVRCQKCSECIRRKSFDFCEKFKLNTNKLD